MRAGVLAFDSVGVIRIHVAQQATQLRRHAGASKQGGHAGQVMRFGQQRLQTRIGRDQGFKLLGLGVNACIFAKFC
jgi:hypothetical protein